MIMKKKVYIKPEMKMVFTGIDPLMFGEESVPDPTTIPQIQISQVNLLLWILDPINQ